MKQKIIIALLSLVVFNIAQADQQDCSGTNSVNGAMVYGTCSEGSFTGHDSVDGSTVYGTCSGGSFTGYESPSGASVSGTCTIEPTQ
jgi:hypothetical protein